MNIISESGFEDVIEHLKKLGKFDEEDTGETIRPHHHFYLIELTEEEFLNCVFLASSSTSHFVIKGEDRKLITVAANAVRNIEKGKNLGDGHWNLTELIAETEVWINSEEPPSTIVLRDLQLGEMNNRDAFKYIHDGSHRSLGHAIKIISGEINYIKVTAFLATNTKEKFASME